MQTQLCQLDRATLEFYRRTLAILKESNADFLLGGAYALHRYAEIERHTKDLDIFVRRSDCERVLEILSRAGYETDLTYPHWLGKAFCGGDFVDVIFSSGNGVAEVTDEWFEHAAEGEVFGLQVKLCPPEEILWSKMLIMERERFDGADVAHLLRACAEKLDWPRLLRHFEKDWQVLLSHLILFGYIYPSDRDAIPARVMDELLARLKDERETAPPAEKVCRGTILSRAQYLIDIDRWGYADARLAPRGGMTREDIDHWTAAIEKRK